MFWSRSVSLVEERNRINKEYLNARQQLIAYKNQMPEIYHASVERFIDEMQNLHTGARVPTAALIRAITTTKGFLNGDVGPAEYGKVIHEMNRGQSASYEPSRLSQAMVTLSWAVWVLSLAFLLAGGLVLGILGLCASYAIYHDAEHTEVKYPNAHIQRDSTQIGEQMETIRALRDYGVPTTDQLYTPA